MGSENDNQTQPDAHMYQGQGECPTALGARRHTGERPRGQKEGERASLAPQAATNAALFHCGSTAQTESHLCVQGCGHGKNTLISFSKEPTAQLERRTGTSVPSNHNRGQPMMTSQNE